MKSQLLDQKSLFVKKSSLPEAGKGLFTKTSIKKGTPIVEYKGKITTWKEVQHDEGKNGYIYYITRNLVIDAGKYRSALARYANDARGLKRINGTRNNAKYVEKGRQVFITATKDIQPGEEIFVGYGKEYWDVIRHNLKIDKQREKTSNKKTSRKN
ncbi:MAG: SET domain-containing protein-lysine N-methyltransferase [Chitinophagaceae bacterium]|nr:SET domain-containing protein-lysine N-methyltransferase [Chitinophagaceae bacterium]